MKHYEKILSKVTPTFFKLLQYGDYFEPDRFHKSYKDYLLLPIKNMDYYFDISNYDYLYPYKEKMPYRKSIELGMVLKGKSADFNNMVTYVEFVVNMVINNFSFENKHVEAFYVYYNKDFKDLFIDLVGQDMYNTLKSAIR